MSEPRNTKKYEIFKELSIENFAEAIKHVIKKKSSRPTNLIKKNQKTFNNREVQGSKGSGN